MNWTLIEKSLPDNPGWYLVYAATADKKSPLITMAFWNPSDGWFGLVDFWIEYLTHWMPLPAAPKDKGKPFGKLHKIKHRQPKGFDKLDLDMMWSKSLKRLPAKSP